MYFKTDILARWIFVLMEQIKADLLIFYAHLQHFLSHVYHAARNRHEWAAKNERNVSILFYIYDNEISWKYNVFNLHQNIFNDSIWSCDGAVS